MKPLFRWTIGGNPCPTGFEVFFESIQSVRKLYGDEFDYVVCYNNLTSDQLSYISQFGIRLIEQRHCAEMEYEPVGVAWKLYPPRLRDSTHEIFMDNDIVLYSRPREVEEFLASKDVTFITEGFGNNEGKGNYGKYFENMERHSVCVNSGFFGLPPYFPFAQLIRYYQASDENRSWENYFDEQGLVASCILNHSPCLVIPISDIGVCVEDLECPLTPVGSHFSQVNIGYTLCWLLYQEHRKQQRPQIHL